jgi:hypothetical protein
MREDIEQVCADFYAEVNSKWFTRMVRVRLASKDFADMISYRNLQREWMEPCPWYDIDFVYAWGSAWKHYCKVHDPARGYVDNEINAVAGHGCVFPFTL